jgi:aspartate carbamoyltransferase catalytic subunit
MASVAKKIAVSCFNETSTITSMSFAHGRRSYVPKKWQKTKRLFRRIADVKAERYAWKDEQS